MPDPRLLESQPNPPASGLRTYLPVLADPIDRSDLDTGGRVPSRGVRALYISYDGACEPLGESQIVAYLLRLSATHDLMLVSFEKEADPATGQRVAARLATAGVRWLPLRYHKRPRLLATLLDILRGAVAVRRLDRRFEPDVVNARSIIAAVIALLGTSRRRPLVFDIRGFWSDERVEAGFWRRRSLVDKSVRLCERLCYRRAAAIVTLTRASVPHIAARLPDEQRPIVIIPTCADVQSYAGTSPRLAGPHVTWVGSLGAWYRFDLAVQLAEILGLPFTVLTRQVDLARSELGGVSADVRPVPAQRMPEELHAGDVGLCLIRSTFSKVASAPTRFAEYLAAGMPVVVTAGVGDLEHIVTRHRVGVVIHSEERHALLRAADQILALASDLVVRERCRGVARELYDADGGAQAYAQLYRRLERQA